MTIPTDKKDQAIYHTVLADLHRMRALLLNLQTLDVPHTERSLHEHFSREQSIILGRLTEWRQRRADIFGEANADFEHQVRKETE
jgi:hypothetical protein